MSLNGDVMVIRNGRSTSTVSIYNYPEHLNPFYEDDQHKRLRFWHINKKGDGERRNSFSLGGVKDMWAFKSFRTKKKSSTLGINKTSESPPSLRREYQIDASNLFNSYDRRARYSSNGTTADGSNNFERNATYRSSLQNIQPTQGSPSGFGLNRNDQYRSTIQFENRNQLSPADTRPVPKPRRYVYGGSITPQPMRNLELGRGLKRDSLTHGSSQSSVSTNPFDSDDNAEENHQHIRGEDGAKSLTGKTTARKKRRAPAPPVPIHSGNDASSSSQTHQLSQTELRIEENLEIANLTAEIESFVKTTNDDAIEQDVKKSTSEEKRDEKEMPKANGTVPKEKLILKTSPNMIITKQFRPQQKPELHISEEVKTEEKPALPEKKKINQNIIITQKEEATPKEVGHVECIHVHVESPRSTPERTLSSRVTSFKKEEEEKPVDKITAKTSFTLASPPANRREVFQNGEIKETITVTTVQKETETVSQKQNGILKESRTTVKPPISAKPTLETNNKTKFNQHFAVIHKPSRRVVLSSETEEITEPPAPTTATNKETITTEETVAPISEKKKFAAEHKLEKSDLGKVTSKPNSNEKPIVFQTTEKTEKTADTVKLSEVVQINEANGPKENQQMETTSVNKTEIIYTAANKPQSNSENITSVTQSQPAATSSLKIVESRENVVITEEIDSCNSPVPSTSNSTSPPLRTASQPNPRDEFEALYRNKPSSHLEWKQSTLAPLEPHVPPEKRKSVKDIIESINRSQRLLHAAAHKDLPLLSTTSQMPPPAYNDVVSEPHVNRQNDNDLSQSLKTLDETQREIERIFEDITAQDISDDTPSPSSSNNAQNATDSQKLNNEEIFKKFRVTKEVYDYRETSPTTSNLDWNPVPKPKRSKNLSDQREL